MKREPITVAIVVSDLHAGCQFGLCPPEVKLDGGNTVTQSRLQGVTWEHWLHFWGTWVPEVTEGRPYVCIVNGDAVEGRHHGTTTQVTSNLAVQGRIAAECLRAAKRLAPWKRLYMLRGTEAHVGPTGETEEALAKEMGACGDGTNRSRYELWLLVGAGLAHFSHHIGTAGSQAYESSALMREYAEACVEAARWGYRPPDWIVRSHRHRHLEIRVPTRNGRGTVVTTPAWQLKTPFCHKIAGARQSMPQIGGVALIAGHAEMYSRSYVINIERSKPEVVYA